MHAIIEILTDLVGPFEGTETHQKAVPLPPLESSHDQGAEGELLHPLARSEANDPATSYADQAVPAETGKEETGPGKPSPPLEITHVADRQPQTKFQRNPSVQTSEHRHYRRPPMRLLFRGQDLQQSTSD